MNRKYFTLALFAGLGLGSVANASVVWNFTSGVAQNTDLSSPQTFTSTGGSPNKTITAYGVHADDGSATDLFAKVGAPSETGLGTNHGSENEIDGLVTSGPNQSRGHFIELDVSSITANTILNFVITSVQSGETFNWGIKDGITAPVALGQFTGGETGKGDTGGDSGGFSFTRDGAAHEFIAISISSGSGADVLLASATVQGGNVGAPEPRFIGLLLVGMLAIPAIRRRFAPQQ